MHGHVREVPLSAMDYLKMMVDGAYEEIALCPSGRYSRIVKLEGEDNKLETTQRKIMKTYKILKADEQVSQFIHICKFICKSVPLYIKVIGKKLVGIEPNIKDYNKYNELIELDKELAADSAKKLKIYLKNWERNQVSDMNLI